MQELVVFFLCFLRTRRYVHIFDVIFLSNYQSAGRILWKKNIHIGVSYNKIESLNFLN